MKKMVLCLVVAAGLVSGLQAEKGANVEYKEFKFEIKKALSSSYADATRRKNDFTLKFDFDTKVQSGFLKNNLTSNKGTTITDEKELENQCYRSFVASLASFEKTARKVGGKAVNLESIRLKDGTSTPMTDGKFTCNARYVLNREVIKVSTNIRGDIVKLGE